MVVVAGGRWHGGIVIGERRALALGQLSILGLGIVKLLFTICRASRSIGYVGSCVGLFCFVPQNENDVARDRVACVGAGVRASWLSLPLKQRHFQCVCSDSAKALSLYLTLSDDGYG
jgi:hypothetical protein